MPLTIDEQFARGLDEAKALWLFLRARGLNPSRRTIKRLILDVYGLNFRKNEFAEWTRDRLAMEAERAA